MARKTFTAELSVKGINNLIKELEQYKKDFNRKVEEFIRKLADIGISVIDENMAKARYTIDADGIQSGADTAHTSTLKINSVGNTINADLVVEGSEILFIEFGSGVYYNAPPGQSTHPKGEEFGFVIGSYGKGHGVQKVWGYYDDNEKLVLTHGVEATMPLYKASMEMARNVYKVAKAVFG